MHSIEPPPLLVPGATGLHQPSTAPLTESGAKRAGHKPRAERGDTIRRNRMYTVCYQRSWGGWKQQVSFFSRMSGLGRRETFKFATRKQRYAKSITISRARRTESSETDNSVVLIQRTMKSIYGSKACERILKSLELNLSGGEFVRQIKGKGEQRASSYIDGLSAIPYHDIHNGQFAWLEKLEQASGEIQQEFKLALTNPVLSEIGNSIWSPAAREDAIAYGPNWRTLVIQDRCLWEDTNSQFFPVTTTLLKTTKCPSVEVFFARQPPNTGIRPHTDNTNFVLTAHLGIDVPEQLSWMKVGEFKRYWENGKGLVADTSFIHSTANESIHEDRYVLIIRFWHPELNTIERQALQFLFDALDDPTTRGIQAAESKARERMPKKALRRTKRSSCEGLGLLSKGMR